MNPHIINLLIKGHQEKIKEQDYLAWFFGQYTLSAVSVAIEHNLAGIKAKSKYIEKPFLNSALEEKEEIAYGESREEIAVFEMKIRAKKLRDCGFAESPM